MNPAAAEAWIFDPDPVSSREARRRVSDVLEAAALDAAVATAAMVVGELAANAVLHACTAFEVRLLVEPEAVRIEVHDQDPRPPVRRNFSTSATNGRGLRLVEELCQAWGVESDVDGGGKTVWALVPIAAAGGPLAGVDLSSVEPW